MKHVEKRYDSDGHLVEQIEMLNEAPHGKKTIFSPTGTVSAEAYYVEGRLNGPSRIWNESGVLICEANYQDNKLNGKYRSWWDDGVLKEEGNYEDDKRIAPYKWFDKKGNVVQRLE